MKEHKSGNDLNAFMSVFYLGNRKNHEAIRKEEPPPYQALRVYLEIQFCLL